MPPIREVTGAGPTLPPEPLGQPAGGAQPASTTGAEASRTSGDTARLAALSAFMEGTTGPVDLPALAQALIQEGAIRP